MKVDLADMRDSVSYHAECNITNEFVDLYKKSTAIGLEQIEKECFYNKVIKKIRKQ